MFKRLDKQKIYQDKWLTFYQDTIEFPDGSKGTYAWVDRMSGVGTVVVVAEKYILLHKEFRYVVNDYSWEIPGGAVDAGETPEQAAIREVYEEAGMVLSNVEQLSVFYPLNSFNTESVTLFIASVPDATVHLKNIESSEVISEQKLFTFGEVLEMVDNGTITDSVTASTVQMVIRKLQSQLN